LVYHGYVLLSPFSADDAHGSPRTFLKISGCGQMLHSICVMHELKK